VSKSRPLESLPSSLKLWAPKMPSESFRPEFHRIDEFNFDSAFVNDVGWNCGSRENISLEFFARAPGDSRSADAGDRSADTLTGTVTDETGANVAGAIVKVTDPAKQLERQVTTNSDGHFILPQLPPSRYKWMTLAFEVK
jgi:Carboxypeptidase regulatory-like domain